MRSTFALLAAALLAGCGLTDGPNRTGSSWLDDIDLGLQGLETVSVTAVPTGVLTMLDPGVPALNGVGRFAIGQPEGLGLVSSVWFDPQDTTRWKRSRPTDSARGPWSLELRLTTTCPSSGDLDVQLYRNLSDTLPFLLGAAKGSPDASLQARCKDSVTLVAAMGDSTFLSDSTRPFGLRLSAEGFPVREVSSVRLVDGVGDTLLHGLHAGRGAWGSRWWVTSKGALSTALDAGTRLRLRFDGETLRRGIASGLGLATAGTDSFDNTVSIFSARAVSRVTRLTDGTIRRFRLASWVVLSRDTTAVDVPASNGQVQAAFRSHRPSDGNTFEGTLSVFPVAEGLVGVSLLYKSDTMSLVTPAGTLQNRFHLFSGDSIEANVYGSNSWLKLGFQYKDGKILFTRAVLSDVVVADDQAESFGEGAYQYREEAVARATGTVRYEARSAFQRIVNRKTQEVWTDLYAVPMDDDNLPEGNASITLASPPVETVTFQVRRRTQGVVQ